MASSDALCDDLVSVFFSLCASDPPPFAIGVCQAVLQRQHAPLRGRAQAGPFHPPKHALVSRSMSRRVAAPHMKSAEISQSQLQHKRDMRAGSGVGRLPIRA